MTYQLPEPADVYYVEGVKYTRYTADQMQAAYAAGVAAERAACVDVCSSVYYKHIGAEYGEARYGIAACSKAIHSRGEDMSDLSALRGIQGVGL